MRFEQSELTKKTESSLRHGIYEAHEVQTAIASIIAVTSAQATNQKPLVG